MGLEPNFTVVQTLVTDTNVRRVMDNFHGGIDFTLPPMYPKKIPAESPTISVGPANEPGTRHRMARSWFEGDGPVKPGDKVKVRGEVASLGELRELARRGMRPGTELVVKQEYALPDDLGRVRVGGLELRPNVGMDRFRDADRLRFLQGEAGRMKAEGEVKRRIFLGPLPQQPPMILEPQPPMQLEQPPQIFPPQIPPMQIPPPPHGGRNDDLGGVMDEFRRVMDGHLKVQELENNRQKLVELLRLQQKMLEDLNPKDQPRPNFGGADGGGGQGGNARPVGEIDDKALKGMAEKKKLEDLLPELLQDLIPADPPGPPPVRVEPPKPVRPEKAMTMDDLIRELGGGDKTPQQRQIRDSVLKMFGKRNSRTATSGTVH